jgi:hypothetical protein
MIFSQTHQTILASLPKMDYPVFNTLTSVFWNLTHTQRVEVQSELLLSDSDAFE